MRRLLALLLLVAGPSCRVEPPFISGRITEVGSSWGFLVEARTDSSLREDKAYVQVGPDTKLSWQDGRRARPADLRVGRRATVWITGNIQDSYPVQVYAQRVVLERDSASAAQ
jgi:hypothetical protein